MEDCFVLLLNGEKERSCPWGAILDRSIEK
jgi:hypothetical protein